VAAIAEEEDELNRQEQLRAEEQLAQGEEIMILIAKIAMRRTRKIL
jgi:hypothetical protein